MFVKVIYTWLEGSERNVVVSDLSCCVSSDIEPASEVHVMGLEATELARWTRFAAKGGIGKCTALNDCVAESADDLMFLKDDEIIVLLQIPDSENQFLGYCEGVVGRFSGGDVQFHSKLKKAIKTKRSSVSAGSHSGKSPTPSVSTASVRVSPAPTPISRPGSSNQLHESRGPIGGRLQAQIPASPRLAGFNTDEESSRHMPSMSFSAVSAASDSVVSTPAIAQFPSHSPHVEGATSPRYVPSPLSLVSSDKEGGGPTSPLRINKRSPPPHQTTHFIHHQPLVSPLPPVPDSSYSTFEDHAARLDVGNDTEIGIGLSLLGDLTGGSYSSDEDEEGDEAGLKRVGNRRDSLTESGEGTAEGLGYAKSEEDHEPPKNAFLPPLASPTSPSFSPPNPPYANRDRRPSLAPSAISTSSWEGASDIYDDYRYSRYSIKPTNSERSRTDSLASRTRTDSNKSRTDSLPPNLMKRSTLTKERTMSVDSDASVYTRDSRLSSLSKDAVQLLSQAGQQPSRPAPLILHEEPKEPLLGTAWGSPLSSSGFSDPQSSSFLHTPIPGRVESAKALAGLSLSTGHPPNALSPPPLSPGFASAMRQRLETDRTSPRPESGLGTRIVVEDEDELPSRILSDSPDPDLTTSTILAREESDSPEPELLLQSRLAPLVVTNRTPSPSILDGASDDGKRPSQAPSPVIPPLPPLTPPTTLTVTNSSPNPLRLSLADLREGSGPLLPGGKRASLFMPHPNAPKPPPVELRKAEGPRYLLAQPSPQGQQSTEPTEQPTLPMQFPHPPPAPLRPNVIGVMRMALGVPIMNRPPTGPAPSKPIPPRGPTFYGRTEVDLKASVGPVPIIWSVEPPPPMPFQPTGSVPPRPSTTGPAINRGASLGPRNTANAFSSDTGAQQGGAGPLPRANFFPKAPGVRPRSRSFSGFNSKEAEVKSQKSNVEQLKQSSSSPLISAQSSPSSSSSPPSASTTPPSSSGSTPPGPKPPISRPASSSPLRPSPLSIAHNSISGPSNLRPSLGSPGLKPSAPTSPLAQSITIPPPQSTNTSSSSNFNGPSIPNGPPPLGFVPNLGGRALRAVGSRATLNELPVSTPAASSNAPNRPSPMTRSTLPPGGFEGPASITLRSGSPAPSLGAGSGVDVRGSYQPPLNPNQPVRRPSLSLRPKLSLPNLRRKQSKNDEDPVSPSLPSPQVDSAISSLGFGSGNQNPSGMTELLQVQDMEFELVRPKFGAAARTSEDSGVLPNGKERSLDLGDSIGGRDGFLRAESPAISVSSGGGMPRSPLGSDFEAGRAGGSTEGGETPASMEAHRNRELKWLSLISSVPPSQAKKSKKVKKLINEGIPASVRYPVWSYLTDGKGKCVPGVYAQLCARGKVGPSEEIQRDIEAAFRDHPHLHSTKGSVMSLLQAYLTMVPDVRYSLGLTLIAGQLILMAPEEEAFWIFVSVMDSHIRPYFAVGNVQMEVDASLFAKALEANDGAIGKKVWVELGVSPGRVCIPWFTTLFVDVLPPEYVNRVWDHFLFEGIPFLIRVGLAIMACSRQRLLQCTSEDTLLSMLRRPPSSWLPPSPDAFVSLAYAVKVKDDDVRKQRVKMEAMVKRQTQAQVQVPRGVGGSGSISLPRA